MSIISPWSQFSPPDRKQPRYQLGKGSLANRNGRGSMIPTNVRCIESTKAGKKTKIAWKTPRMGGFFFSETAFLWTDVFINAHFAWESHGRITDSVQLWLEFQKPKCLFLVRNLATQQIWSQRPIIPIMTFQQKKMMTFLVSLVLSPWPLYF